jgi:4-amino-4-deoxychorismate lyase
MMTLVNGEVGGQVDPGDRGLQFGDGVFETVRLKDGRPVLWDRHWSRLCRGLQGLGIPVPREQDCLDDFARIAEAPLAMAKLIVTRGPGPRGYAIPEQVHPTRIVTGGSTLAIGDDGHILRLGVCRTRTACSPLPGCKHLNRLENVLARREWKPDWDEGLMLDGYGNLTCGTQSNVFILEADCLLTPPVSQHGVAGTRRGWLLEHGSRRGLTVREATLPLERVRQAEAVFLTNSRIGMRRAVWADGRGSVTDRAAGPPAMDLVLQAVGELNALA